MEELRTRGASSNAQSDRSKSPVAVGLWQVPEVAEWLEENDLAKHRKVFGERMINGKKLLALKSADLAHMGITVRAMLG